MAKRNGGNGNGGNGNGGSKLQPGVLVLRATDRFVPEFRTAPKHDREIIRKAGNVAGGIVIAVLAFRFVRWAWTTWRGKPA